MSRFSIVLISSCLLVYSTGCQSTDPNSLEQLKSDYSNLEGKWELKNLIVDGQEENDFIGAVYEFNQDRMTLTTPDGEILEYQFFLAPSEAGPNRFDSIQTEGIVLTTPPLKTIYQIEGDTLKFCASLEDYPKEFSAPEGSKRVLSIMRRVETKN